MTDLDALSARLRAESIDQLEARILESRRRGVTRRHPLQATPESDSYRHHPVDPVDNSAGAIGARTGRTTVDNLAPTVDDDSRLAGS